MTRLIRLTCSMANLERERERGREGGREGEREGEREREGGTERVHYCISCPKNGIKRCVCTLCVCLVVLACWVCYTLICQHWQNDATQQFRCLAIKI